MTVFNDLYYLDIRFHLNHRDTENIINEECCCPAPIIENNHRMMQHVSGGNSLTSCYLFYPLFSIYLYICLNSLESVYSLACGECSLLPSYKWPS